MTQLEKLEAKLDEVLDKKAPYKLPENARKSLANALWWLALVSGVLQLWSAWVLWDTWHKVDRAADIVNSYAATVGLDYGINDVGFAFYPALVALALSGALLLLASTGLKAMKKAGWNLVFYSLLVNLVYGVFVVFTRYGDQVTLFGALLGSLIGAYLLFQVRSRFTKAGTVAHKA